MPARVSNVHSFGSVVLVEFIDPETFEDAGGVYFDHRAFQHFADAHDWDFTTQLFEHDGETVWEA